LPARGGRAGNREGRGGGGGRRRSEGAGQRAARRLGRGGAAPARSLRLRAATEAGRLRARSTHSSCASWCGACRRTACPCPSRPRRVEEGKARRQGRGRGSVGSGCGRAGRGGNGGGAVSEAPARERASVCHEARAAAAGEQQQPPAAARRLPPSWQAATPARVRAPASARRPPGPHSDARERAGGGPRAGAAGGQGEGRRPDADVQKATPVPTPQSIALEVVHARAAFPTFPGPPYSRRVRSITHLDEGEREARAERSTRQF
jgi:hypothetical protein